MFRVRGLCLFVQFAFKMKNTVVVVLGSLQDAQDEAAAEYQSETTVCSPTNQQRV